MLLKDCIASLEKKSQDLQSPIPLRQIEDLVGYHLGLEWGDLQLKKQLEVSPSWLEKINADFERMKKGEPLAYVIGESFFYKNKFKCDSRALIPRPETELLVEKALEYASSPNKVLDIGAGTGCVGLSVAQEYPLANVYMVDASAEALELCQENADELGLTNVTLVKCELGQEVSLALEPLKFDIILSNPPYIASGDPRVGASVANFEPTQALYAEENGTYWIRLWLEWSYQHLENGAYFLFEFGKNQEEEIAQLVAQTQFKIVQWVKDYSGAQRCIVLQK